LSSRPGGAPASPAPLRYACVWSYGCDTLDSLATNLAIAAHTRSGICSDCPTWERSRCRQRPWGSLAPRPENLRQHTTVS